MSEESLKPQYLISACYFPHTQECELTYERISDGKRCALTLECDEQQGEDLVGVIDPCVYFRAELKDTRPIEDELRKQLEEISAENKEILAEYAIQNTQLEIARKEIEALKQWQREAVPFLKAHQRSVARSIEDDEEKGVRTSAILKLAYKELDKLIKQAEGK